jgi:hypothetical protein
MPKLSLTLSDDEWRQLEEAAARQKLTPEELAHRALQEAVRRPALAFDQLVAYILEKNGELYRRLI